MSLAMYRCDVLCVCAISMSRCECQNISHSLFFRDGIHFSGKSISIDLFKKKIIFHFAKISIPFNRALARPVNTSFYISFQIDSKSFWSKSNIMPWLFWHNGCDRYKMRIENFYLTPNRLKFNWIVNGVVLKSTSFSGQIECYRIEHNNTLC